MDVSSDMIKITSEFAGYLGKRSVEAIFDKIRAVKKKGDQNEIISNLEEIINELIADKNQLIQITQAYEEQLITQKMSEKDIEYITNSIVPLLEELLEQSEGNDAENLRKGIDTFKPILSKETFNIMQMLGFNFKQAIGEPLTKLVCALISSKIPSSIEISTQLQILIEQRQIELLKISQDKESYQRLFEIFGKY